MNATLRGAIAVVRQSLGTFFGIWQLQLEYAVLVAALLLAAARWRWWSLFGQQPWFWLPPLVACASYSLVLVELRYVAPFVLLLWLAAISALLSRQFTGELRRFIYLLFLAVALVTGVKITKSAASDLLAIRSGQQNVSWDIAQDLHALGLRPGDRVAGLGPVAEAQWARIAGVKIVAEIPLGDENIFWTSDAPDRRRVLQMLHDTGATMVVTKYPTLIAITDGWHHIMGTGYWVYVFKRD